MSLSSILDRKKPDLNKKMAENEIDVSCIYPFPAEQRALIDGKKIDSWVCVCVCGRCKTQYVFVIRGIKWDFIVDLLPNMLDVPYDWKDAFERFSHFNIWSNSNFTITGRRFIIRIQLGNVQNYETRNYLILFHLFGILNSYQFEYSSIESMTIYEFGDATELICGVRTKAKNMFWSALNSSHRAWRHICLGVQHTLRIYDTSDSNQITFKLHPNALQFCREKYLETTFVLSEQQTRARSIHMSYISRLHSHVETIFFRIYRKIYR